MAVARVVHTADRTLTGRQLASLLTPPPEGRFGYRELARAVREALLDGRVALRLRLPAERELATVLEVSRTTVTGAYDLLRESGYAHSRRGAGTWTALPDGQTTTPLGAFQDDAGATIDLALAAPQAPADELAAALTAAAAELPRYAGTQGYHPYGLPVLRAAIAERYTARGLPTLPEQILVTTGAQQALSLVLTLLGRTGDRVLAENPSYTNALDAMRGRMLRITPVPVTEAGWDTGLVDAALRQTAPRLAYLIPDFHNPTGHVMPQEQRRELARAARATGTWLVADETLTDIALDVPVPVPFAAAAGGGDGEQIVSVGSLSKSCWGGLRVGWVRAASRVVNELARVRITADLSGSVLDQLVAVELMDRLDTILPQRVEELRRRRDALTAALARHVPEWRWTVPPGGMCLWIDLGRPVASSLAARALRHGVRVEGGARFGVDPGTHEHRLRIPYTLPEDVYEPAAERLAAALDGAPGHFAGAALPDWVA
ncbi:PLP-dependent aminotransferase family protein [Streptomyces sp. NBC_00094]|uniref:MocR-like transcription factor YczR n=1 Tax=Streptomyces sp. NBC_00094 TaxID=2903620 RepID=UPI002250B038|nr:PLP-dependent aminotransferase family protein [Streptomyces sp. NBC_00094]MCX5388793.1 PLP-dependent aminotransferase family protein [Streptomyces sp. NBC_00094]